jgi:hypothetical protein
MSTVGNGFADVAVGTGNQCRRMAVPSNEVSVQSLATPATRVAAIAEFAGGGTQRAGAAVVGGEEPAVDDAAGADVFEADDEHAASAATSRAEPIRPSRDLTLFPQVRALARNLPNSSRRTHPTPAIFL